MTTDERFVLELVRELELPKDVLRMIGKAGIAQQELVRHIQQLHTENAQLRQERDNYKLAAEMNHETVTRMQCCPHGYSYDDMQTGAVSCARCEEQSDPTPYCSYGHRTKADCDCGPIAEND